jgi:hypothetical protein
VLKGIIKAPVIKKLKAIVFNTVPRMTDLGCKPFYEISQGHDYTEIASNRNENLPFYYSHKD